MAKPSGKIKKGSDKLSKKKTITPIPKTVNEDTVVLFEHFEESLMPELEELVKKNPNRLIGCGG